MTYIERILRAVDYIESNLDNHISYEEAASRAFLSRFYFQRIFKALAGEAVGQYIRKRRLSEAGRALLTTSKPIIEIAMTYGFESQESFTRAFSKLFDTTPGRFRRAARLDEGRLKRPIDKVFLENLKGGTSMKPKFIEKGDFTIVGLASYFSKATTSEIPPLWCKFVQRMGELKNASPTVLYGFCDQPKDVPEDKEFRYMACMEVEDKNAAVPDGLTAIDVPAKRYAVFTHKGPITEIAKTYDYIYGTWLPESDYEADGSHDFEYYDERFNNGNPMDPESELDVYIPVKEKA